MNTEQVTKSGLSARKSKKVAERHFFEFSHSVLAPMARPAPHAGKALLRSAFCGFAAHPQGPLSAALQGQPKFVSPRNKPPRGCGLSQPQVFRQAESGLCPLLFIYFVKMNHQKYNFVNIWTITNIVVKSLTSLNILWEKGEFDKNPTK